MNGHPVLESSSNMTDTLCLGSRRSLSVRWMARFLSVVTDAAFLIIVVLALTNEDRPQGAAIAVLALLLLTLAATFAAWRWERVGGTVVVLLALCLGIAAYSASSAIGLGSASLLPALIYSVPFLLVGCLFWVSGQVKANG